LLEGEESERIKENLKWLSEQLGPARDFDVFVQDEVPAMEQDQNRHASLASLEQSLVARRDKAMAQAKAVVAGERYRHIVLETGLWAIAGEWAKSSDEMETFRRERPIKAVAEEILDQRTRKVLKKLARLKKMDAMKRHKLRIAVKKLRYAEGFFRALYNSARANRERKVFQARLRALQNALGRLNDIHVHQQFASNEIAKRKRGKVKVTYGLGFVAGRELASIPDCVAAAAKTGKRFGRHSHYWS
jgi:triphosphatase